MLDGLFLNNSPSILPLISGDTVLLFDHHLRMILRRKYARVGAYDNAISRCTPFFDAGPCVVLLDDRNEKRNSLEIIAASPVQYNIALRQSSAGYFV